MHSEKEQDEAARILLCAYIGVHAVGCEDEQHSSRLSMHSLIRIRGTQNVNFLDYLKTSFEPS
jgi:hypothetical protein